MWRSAAFLAALICLLIPFTGSLTIVSPPSLAGKHINSPIVNPTIYKFHPARGPIIDANVNASCAEARGHILLLSNESTPGLPLQRITYQMQQCGAIGVIFRDKVSDYAGVLGATYSEETPLINITMVGVSKIDGPYLARLIAEAAANGSFIEVDFEGVINDVNYWDLWGAIPLGIVLQVLVTAFCIVVSTLSLAKLIAFIRHVGFAPLTVPQLVLIIRIVSNWFRTIYWATDPMFLGRYYSFSVGQILLTISFPFEIVGTLTFAFYWQQLLTNKKVVVSNFLTKMRIPIIVISILLLIMEFTFAGFRAALFDISALSIISSVAYVIINLAAVSYFVFMGVKVIRQLRSGTADGKSFGSRSGALIRRTIIFVCLTAFFTFAWSLTLIGAASDEFLNNPFFFRSLIMTWFVLLECNSLVSVLSVRAPFPGVDSSKTEQLGHGLSTSARSRSQSTETA